MRLSNVLFALGIIFVISSFVVPLVPFATIITDTTPPTILASWPGMATSATYPQNLGAPGTIVELFCTTNEQLSSATVQITPPAGAATTLTLASAGLTSGGNWKYNYMWTIPTTQGVYSFKYTATDLAGNVASMTCYGQPTGTVDGYFTVNGKQVAKDDVVRINSLTVNFGFVATSGATTITSVQVFVYSGAPSSGPAIATVNLVKQSSGTSWAGQYVFPHDGTYTVNGVIYPGAAMLMSLLFQASTSIIPQFNVYLLIIGIVFMGAGVPVRIREEQ